MNEGERVRDVKVKANADVKSLISLYRDIHGFMASNLAIAADILAEGVKEADLRFISFTGNLIATGVRGIISQLIDEGVFNVVITTCGALDHDIAKSLGGLYIKGSFDVDDVDLEKRGIHRLGNIFIPFESYGLKVEAFVKELIPKALKVKEEWSVRELLNLAGELLKDDPNSILGAAYRRGVPVYVPGITDGAFGTNLFMYSQQTPFKLNILKDVKEIMDLVFNSKKSLALVLGGGISKHHTIWWNQFKDGLDYAVYITTAVEWDGSLSGAKTKEAISWGKIKPQAKHVTVYGDVTVLLPIIASYLLSFK